MSSRSAVLNYSFGTEETVYYVQAFRKSELMSRPSEAYISGKAAYVIILKTL